MDQTLMLRLLDRNISTMNQTELQALYYSLPIFDVYLGKESVILMALYVPVFLIGFLGNMIVTLLVISNQQLRNSTNFYLCNMALADFLGKVYTFYICYLCIMALADFVGKVYTCYHFYLCNMAIADFLGKEYAYYQFYYSSVAAFCFMNINISKRFVINIKDDLYNYLCQTRICLILFFLILIYSITQFHMKVVVTSDNISNYPFG